MGGAFNREVFALLVLILLGEGGDDNQIILQTVHFRFVGAECTVGLGRFRPRSVNIRKCSHQALNNEEFAGERKGGDDSFGAEGGLDSREIPGPEIAMLFG